MKLFQHIIASFLKNQRRLKEFKHTFFAEKIFFFYSPVTVLLVSKEEFNQIHSCEVFSAIHYYGMIAILRIYRKVSSVHSKSTQHLMNGFLIFLCFFKILKFSVQTFLEFNLLMKNN